MSNKPAIDRRDFLNGMALSLGASAISSPLSALANNTAAQASPAYYPPALTGLRGTHKGAFEVAHSIAWQGKQWPIPSQQTDSDYDLVVVGGGLSGLSAALLFQQQAGAHSRILIIENHDDFGGHAKRNEFTVDGKQLISYGGSQSIDTPSGFSKASAQLLKDLAIDTARFNDYYDSNFKKKWGLKYGLYFSEQHYGKNVLAENPFSWHGEKLASLKDTIDSYPISDSAKKSLLNYLNDSQDITLPAWSYAEKIERLRKLSYYDFLKQYAKLTHEAINTFNGNLKGLWGVGWDALSTLEAVRMGMPGTERLGINYDDINTHVGDEEPYIYHFPDGNAGIARALVRRLIPASMAGTNMEELVLNKIDYSRLDKSDSPVRLRLNSTVVKVQHSQDSQHVNISYVKQGQSFRVQAKHCIMACYNNIIPHICPEVSEQQKTAIGYASKVPLVYANVAVKNWRAFAKAGYSGFHIPNNPLFHNVELDFPVSMGGYQFAQNPDQPIVLHCSMVPTAPYQGLTGREQHKRGRQQLYQLSFQDFEKDLFSILDGALSPYGFDAVKEIAAITVNRWPHGYAYEYNELFEPKDWNRNNGPHIAGRAQIGRISIANSDACAYAYVNGAFDAAHRAVTEQINS
ncbi:NAD(P)/FAD-dependent oxidoreductase [Dasania sp. GY-MA-18]|uniref:NAD(P)/FAD-dependent oxidoreductase n=1 Tax=Dasania phycosphaerae TaxID=2950436 RepID=A0A9J6RJM6_9GAMM|nr:MULTISPECIES: FAD/NAD(P)-binding protein [Dasania]MCR8922174.1 NAD(P)/FAD-dependent oxidoreductase [Dasania sp. GY-MA-18]MCZ0864602.1 NAD(P)/FAD-dependent oxidoreductase [Dasania phycosphaerae]MCZ0868330.1 NAD(P)/FAD-dependent oxidoreductase [Dasania phycosphaerae]